MDTPYGLDGNVAKWSARLSAGNIVGESKAVSERSIHEVRILLSEPVLCASRGIQSEDQNERDCTGADGTHDASAKTRPMKVCCDVAGGCWLLLTVFTKEELPSGPPTGRQKATTHSTHR